MRTSVSNLQQALEAYIFDTENVEKNYELANIYESMNQGASAVLYLMRVAERTEDRDLSYECLLRIGNIFLKQGNRANSVMSMYKQAITLLPHRPEAHFLLARLHERAGKFIDCYMYAEIGLNISKPAPKLRGNVDYPGYYGLKFEKAVAAWWWGRPEEARKLFQNISSEYLGELDQIHKDSIENNIRRLGINPKKSHQYYNQSKRFKFIKQFPGLENIYVNHSQAYQDMFVLAAWNGKRDGTYLEIGSAGPFYGNNTALLEEFGWTGVGIDYQQECVDKYNKERKNKSICADARDVDYVKLCSDIAKDGVIDYLQIDCEPSDVTFEILKKIPFDKFKFGVITYEHDFYADMSKSFRDKAAHVLTKAGYTLIVADVAPDGFSTFEDWWVHPDLVDAESMRSSNGKTDIEKHMFPHDGVRDWGDIVKNKWFHETVNKEIFIDNVYQRFVQVEEGDVVLDIGASVGPFIQKILPQKPSKIIALEPSPELYRTLSGNFPGEKIPLVLYNKAISSKSDLIEINTLFNPASMTTGIPRDVIGTTFRDLLKQEKLNKIDFLKIDCEGGEYDVFTEENFNWITTNIRKISGEFHLENPEQKQKFREFRDRYLKHFNKYWVESWDYVDIKWDLWNDSFIEYYSCISIHIDNSDIRFPYPKFTQHPTMEITTAIPEKGCIVDCDFCPQNVLKGAYKSDDRILRMDKFMLALETIPKEVRITFSGFVEPWMNKYATDMVEYAYNRGHPVSVFTTGVGMSVDDVRRLSKLKYSSGPNGGFVLHLPDQERIAKHPLNETYIKVIEEFGKHQFDNFYVMCMSENVHDSVKHVYPEAHLPEFWHRAGNLIKEARFNPRTKKLFEDGKIKTIVHKDDRTCGCVENLYHNVMLPNGDISLCCMDYGLDHIIGNIHKTPYNEIIPKPLQCFDICRSCENGVKV